MKPVRSMALAVVLAGVAALATAAPAAAYVDPPGCPTEVAYDAAVPTFEQVVGVPLGAGGTGSTPRRLTADLYEYFDALVEHTAGHARVKVIRKSFGTSVLGTDLRFYVVSTPDNIANLDAGRADGPFWEGVKDGSVSEQDGLRAAFTRPALGWVTSTPHGDEPAAGEATARLLYELVARTDCWNLRRLNHMDLFIMPVRNPDGRDAPPGGARTSAWAFDHNRDFGTQNQVENGAFLPLLKRYPGLFFIDAHQQANGYFFPPNEDPVHHEVSDFSLNFIQNRIGPALQQKFNDQTTSYRNYNTYDLLVPEYGDSVPTLLSGAAGMTFEKGRNEVYGKQVYDHYLAMDETINVTVRDKGALLADWTRQWQQAVDQGADCLLQANKLVSPLRPVVEREVPADLRICGYFYRPDNHGGDAAELVRHMQRQGVHVLRFDAAARLAGVHEFGDEGATTRTLPAGTLYIPMNQPLKHWIQAVLGEDPYQPLNLFYDVAQWSYSLQRGMTGNGVLMEQPSGVPMSGIADPDFGAAPPSDRDVYAFDTDSMQGLALAIDLLEADVTVYRAEDPFDVAGKHFETGAALVDGASLEESGVDLAALADKRQTLVSGLTGYPVDAFELTKPKIGLFTGGATEPNNPTRPLATSAYPGHCAVNGNVNYCAALYTLTRKIGLPDSMVQPITTTDLAAGRLVTDGFTALINHPANSNAAIAAGPNAAAVQAFVNQGGVYVGQLNGGTTTARNAGLTLLNTNTIAGLSTPGSFFTAAFDTSNPVAWGFDNGGFLYRENVGVPPVYDPATLAGDGGAIGPATAAVSYGNPLKSFGFAQNALGDGQLPGRPAVVDQPFGAGHAIMVGFDSFFRAWRESDERLILNAVLYPDGPLVTPAVAARDVRVAGQVLARPVAADDLPAVRTRRLAAVSRTARDVRIKVARRDGAKLRRAVRAARLPKRVQRKARFVTRRRTVMFVARNTRRQANDHDRGTWVGEITGRLKRDGVTILLGQL